MKYYDFYNQYLDLPKTPKTSGMIPVKCCFHEDTQPSAGVDLATGIFNCFKCGTFSAPRFLQKMFSSANMGLPEAAGIVDAYRREKGIIKKKETFVNYQTTNPKWDNLAKEALNADMFNGPGSVMVKEYAESRGLQVQTLIDAEVGWLPASKLKHVFWPDAAGVRDALVFPYIANGKVIGIRYRDNEGNKTGEIGCHFSLWGVDSLEGKKVAVVVEGESDRLRVLQLVASKKELEHCAVVSTPTGTFRLEWRREFDSIQRIVIIPQADEASTKLVEKAQITVGERMEILSLPWKRGQVGKDICEWANVNDEEELAISLEVMAGDPTRRFMTGWEFQSATQGDRLFLVDHLLARRQVAIIGGQMKHKKTFLALNMIRASMYGELFCGIPGLEGKGNTRWLIVEEEGDGEDLRERAELVFQGGPWQDYTVWGHHLGVKLDDANWLSRIIQLIGDEKIDGVLIDPFQRMYSGDENSASEMGQVWDNIHKITTKFKHIGLVIVHHFGKGKTPEQGWDALRGSSRHGQEADLGVFFEKKKTKGGDVFKMALDGRTLKPWTFNLDADGFASTMSEDYTIGEDAPDLWTMHFNRVTGQFEWDRDLKGDQPLVKLVGKDKGEGVTGANGKVIVDSPETLRLALMNLMGVRGYALVRDVCTIAAISQPTLRRWIAEKMSEDFLISKGKILWKR